MLIRTNELNFMEYVINGQFVYENKMLYSKRSSFRIFDKGQPQGISPTILHVVAIPCGCPIIRKFERLKYNFEYSANGDFTNSG